MSRKRKITLGEAYGLLTVIEEIHPYVSPKNKERKRKFKCRCECGTIVDRFMSTIISKSHSHCGCRHGDNRRTHGLRKHPLWYIHQGMKNRCYNPNHSQHKYYGDKGIGVCDEWRNNVKAFYDWMMTNGWEKGLSIDRIDNNKGYSPSNCRIATPTEQSNNRYCTMSLEWDGEIYTLSNLCRHLGIFHKYKTIIGRLNRGLTIEEAVQNLPV